MTQTPEQVRAQQKQRADRELAVRKAALKDPPAVKANGLPAAVPPDTRSPVERTLDAVAPEFMPPAIVFDGKEARFTLAGTDETIDPQRRFVAHTNQARLGYKKFNGEGEPPTSVDGGLYDPGFVLPSRESLGDTNEAGWPISKLTGRPEDPWKLEFLVPLQDAATLETYCFRTMSQTGRTAVSALLRNYERSRRTKPSELPIIQLRPSSYQHKTYGKVSIPSFPVVGYVSTAKSDTLASDLNDEIGF